MTNSQPSRSRQMLGTGALVLGVVLCAAYGARLGDADFAATVAEGQTALLDQVPDGTASRPAGLGRLQDWWQMAGWPFVLGLGLVCGGALTLRGRGAATGGVGAAQPLAFPAELDRLQEELGRLSEQASDRSVDAHTICQHIETLLSTRVEPLIAARYELQQASGVAVFGAVVSAISGAERLLNRAWSASVDGHRPEALDALGLASAQVQAARDALNGA